MATFTGQPGSKTRQCQAKKKNGERCGRYAIQGGAVCPFHGGSAPQVKEAAKMRLARLVDPAIAVMERFVKPGRGNPVIPALALQAAKDILDRNGFKHQETLHVDLFSVDPKELTDEQLNMVIALREGLASRRAAAEAEHSD